MAADWTIEEATERVDPPEKFACLLSTAMILSFLECRRRSRVCMVIRLKSKRSKSALRLGSGKTRRS